MGVTRRHTLYGVERYDSSSPVVFGGIKGQTIEADNEIRADTSSGEIYPTHVAMVSQMLRATFETTSLAVALGSIGLTGLAITSSNPINLYAYKMAEGSGRTSGSNHRKYTVNEGIVVPRRLYCDHQGDARLEYLVLPTYDGTNDPVVIADSQALPTQGVDTARFSIGACTLESLSINHITSFELDFGIVSEQESSDSDKWATHVSLQEIKPVLRLRGKDIEWLKSSVIPLEGKPITNANTKVYLRKRSASTASGYVANGTSAHVKLVMTGLAHITTLFDGKAENNPPAEVALEMPLYYDGSNAPVVITTGSAIT